MRPIPPPPQTQARLTTTFRAPVLDGSVTLPEIYDWHSKNSPNHRLFVYTRDDGTNRTILWPEAVTAVHVGARIVNNLTNASCGDVVAIIAASDTISYFTLMMSIMRANCIPFPISPRNSAKAVAHLIIKVNVKYILVGREQAMIDLVDHALNILANQGATRNVPVRMPVPLFEDLFLPGQEVAGETIPYRRKPDEIAIYLHSSGSTAFPKPVPWTHYRFIQLSLIPWFGDRDLTNTLFSLAVMPMYHGMGILQLCWTASSGLVVGAFEPKSPVQIPTPENLFFTAKMSESDVVFCVPSFVEVWSRKSEYVEWLATRSGVLTGGGPLNKEAGDYMTSQGVSIFMLYGSTEGGIMSPILPAEVGYDWNYFTFPALVTPHMVPNGDNTFELVMVENEYCRPSVINMKINGCDAYATSDLMVPHPTKQGYWRIHGRTDDQIMHNTGEKTNPGPLENLLNQDPHVLSSVIFGRGRFQAGVIVDPKPEFKLDLANKAELADFRNKIWPTVEKMNEFAPQHSRLFKEMILVANPSKPFTYTAKNTARRQAILNDYEQEIDRLYDLVEESAQTGVPSPAQWDAAGTLIFVRGVVHQVLVNSNINDNDDLFQNGCDSLQATWIRNTLLRALRESVELDTRKTPANFVYDHSTVSRLSSFMFALARGEARRTDQWAAQRIEEMRVLVQKYTTNLPHRLTETKPTSGADVIVLTGSTGAIGSQLLVSLVFDENVHHIYALNRRHPTKPLKERQTTILAERGLPVEILGDEKVTLLEADYNAPYLGLEEVVYKQIQSTVTHIIHNAWLVNFNLALVSFESNIKLVRTMFDFALASLHSASFMFVSSIGVLRNTADLPQPIPEQAISPEVAVGMGYTESKWVVESILSDVANTTGLSTLVVRVGQVAGASNGAWSTKEWLPSLVQASCKLGCLPTFEEDKVVSWLQAEQVAKALTELRHTSNDIRFAHLVHPRPTSWDNLVKILSNALQLETEPYESWLTKLEAACEKESALNAVVLLPFFRSIVKEGRSDQEAFRLPSLDIARCAAFSTSLSSAKKIEKNDIELWLRYWKVSGVLDA